MFTLSPSISAWSTRWLFSTNHKNIGVKAVKRSLSREMATNTKMFYFANFYNTEKYKLEDKWTSFELGFYPRRADDIIFGRTETTNNITTAWAAPKASKIPNFDFSFGHLFKDKDYFIKLHDQQIIAKNLLKEQLAVLRKEIKETDKILASLPANAKQTEQPEIVDVHAGLSEKKAIITSRIDGYAVVDLHAGAKQTDDVAICSTKSGVASWRTKLTDSVQSLWSGKLWSREAPIANDGFSLVELREGRAVMTEEVQLVPKPNNINLVSEGFTFVDVREGRAIITEHVQNVPQEATLARSSQMEPLPDGAHCPSYLEDTNLHFFFVFESTFLSYPLTHVFLLIIALFYQSRLYVFINFYESLYTIITFSLSFIAQIFLCILGNYINLFYAIWFEYTIFTFTGNLKFQKMYLFLPRLERSYVFRSEPHVMVYIGLKTDW